MNYGLTGYPLGHSLSKEIHSCLFKLHGEGDKYELYETDRLSETFDEILSKLDGFNITIPYKTDIIAKLDFKSELVELFNACNTVKNLGGKFYGYNTDADGFHTALKINNIPLSGSRVLITGAGGVSRMMAFEAVKNRCEVHILARNEIKARALIDEIKSKTGVSAFLISEDEIESGKFDILLQGTPVGMYPKIYGTPVSLLKIQKIPHIFDTIYNPKETLLTRASAYMGNNAANGLYMLAAQAAKAQEIWTGKGFGFDEIEKAVSEAALKVHCGEMDFNLVLIGGPGSGKSTVGRELAHILNGRLVDIDSLIEQREKTSINEIFSVRGEKYFRRLEVDTLAECLNSGGSVISTGGGIVENEKLIDYIKGSKIPNIILHLDVADEIVLERLKNDNQRPLLKGDREKNLKTLMERRRPLYAKMRDIHLALSSEAPCSQTALNAAELILKYLNSLK